MVSVIIPCYNYAHFLPETLDSVLNQTYTNWECVIIDDGSTDNTREVADLYCRKDARFKYIYQKNKGLSAARNTGIINAKGKYLQFLDADDLIKKDKLRVQSDYLSANNAASIVFGDSLFFMDTGIERKYMPCPYPDEPQEYNELINEFKSAFVIKNRIPPCAPLVRKDIINIIGLFDEELFSIEDYDFWLRCLNANLGFSYFQHPDTRALVRQTNTSMRSDNWKMCYYEVVVRMKHHNSFNEPQTKINKRKIKENIKTLLYLIAYENNPQKKKSRTEMLIKQAGSLNLNVFSVLLNILPTFTHPKLVWLFFENKWVAIKTKINGK